jgi:hypothetical protein
VARRTHALHVLDPRVVSALTFTTPEAVAEQLRQRGIDTGDVDLNLNRALTALATTRSFTLSRTVDQLVRVTRLAAGLGPVRKLFRQMEDLRAAEVPDTFRSAEAGLVGIAMPAAIAEALAAIRPFTGDEGREALAYQDLTMIEWLFLGRVQRRVEEDDELWQAWSDLAAALADADERKQWLGLQIA